ncbi:HD domain-containing protein [Virgibacillus sp. MSJ-26]|uniref:HD domain-containing protein n=1 Tax=Virgibacillus sp. MSJ-26 TaxID=2841522 RepID=UPI001C107E44|nr:HD domain-containing protein [Virgibacillus sp. MSJ-26]MBU5467591.1 HD domain-containing protein [Virgibacillus sp. MSJ-26]
MRKVNLEDIFLHPITQKYLARSGIAHAITVAEYAFLLAHEYGVNPDQAAKAGLLHDIGHYTWYRDGKWDYDLYKENDIHAIKGASRAHKLLIRIGEERHIAKEIAIAILLHTDSYLPQGHLELQPLQQVVTLADEKDEETGGNHHYRQIEQYVALERIRALDIKIDQKENPQNNHQQKMA